jgi:hypothetical protein
MKRLLVLSLMLLFAAGVATAGSISHSFSTLPVIADSSTRPDSFGYTWVDNDNGGSPVYNWVDITNRGVRVNGLTDDNSVGPFQLGFAFPYYWYTVDHIQSLGSNGYISFSQSNVNFAQPFSSIPNDSLPTDLVAPLGGDLDFTDSSLVRPHSCWFWTNGVDSAVVSWINVSEWNSPATPDTTHTFQLIICGHDSSMTFQYGENHGTFLNSNGAVDDVIGMANVTKRVGVQYLRNNVPANHIYHNGLAIRWHAIPNPNFVAHDFGVKDGFHEGSGADFIANNTSYVVHGIYKNYGNQTETNCKAVVRVQRGSTTVLADTFIIASMAPTEEVNVTFNRQFSPTIAQMYKVTFSAILTGDQNPTNNTKICELDVYSMPQDLLYSTSSAIPVGKAWNGGGGFGNEFVVPEAIILDSSAFYCASVTAAGPVIMYLIGSDSLGNPNFGQTFQRDSIWVGLNDTGWVAVHLNNIAIAANYKFFVVSIAPINATIYHGVDNTAPFSFRGYEYAGGLNPDRDRNTEDIMIRVHAMSATGINADITPKSFSLSQNYPNPFNAHTNISFSLNRASDVNINIYNVVGQIVNTISGHYLAGKNTVTWDASGVASGVYFYKLSIGDVTQTRKMILLK